jgi:2-keto-4-pentenoate hydratase
MGTLDRKAVSAAATLLWRHWTAGTKLSHLPEDVRPLDRSSGYAIQTAVAALSGQRIVGWKIAATSIVGQQHIGVDGPLAGCLLSNRVATVTKARTPREPTSLDGNGMRVAEAEFAFRLRASLPPRERVYGVQEVLDAVESVHPAIEVPDSRYVDYSRVGAPQLIADCACACWLIVGEPADVDWRPVDLASHRVATFLNDQPSAAGVGSNVLRDPRLALTWLANELRTYGQGLTAGDLVTTGTCIDPVKIAPGDTFRVEFGALGNLQVQLV